MIISTTVTLENITHIYQKRRLKAPHDNLVERRTIKTGIDWVKTGAWRLT